MFRYTLVVIGFIYRIGMLLIDVRGQKTVIDLF